MTRPIGSKHRERAALQSPCEDSSSAPSGLDHFHFFTHGSRRGLYSCAASRLLRASLPTRFSEILVLTQTLQGRARRVCSRPLGPVADAGGGGSPGVFFGGMQARRAASPPMLP